MSGEATQYLEFTSIRKNGNAKGYKTEFTESYTSALLPRLAKTLDILSKSPAKTLSDFVKNQKHDCFDKAHVLRLLPGFGNMSIETPYVLLDKANNKLLEFPYILESLTVSAVGDHPIIKLKGGRRTRKTKVPTRI